MLASSIFLTALAGFVSLSTAGYVLEDDYGVDNFFSMFDFFTDADPTNGYVTYVSQSAAEAGGLVNTNNNAVYMGVDSTNTASGSGRQSVRLTSKKSYNHGLIIVDISHMPGGICGTWPAFWTVGPNWPEGGEIDIIEGVNSQAGNAMTLHTDQGCSIASNGLFSGSITTPNCDVKAQGQPTNAGCQILTSNTASYGSGFNQGQGGVYATEWTSSHISIWFFPRSAIPSDISSGNPDPSNWGQPSASFAGGCEIDSFFSGNQIVFDTTFCGDWAGNVWSSDPVCGSKAPTCESFVQNNPAAFKDAYWAVNSLKVYQSPDGGSVPSPPIPSQGPPPTSFGPSITASFPPVSGVSSVVPSGVPSIIPSGVPSGVPPPPPSPVNSQVPTTGFSRGGNGRHTRTGGGNANFVAVETGVPTAAATPDEAANAEGASATTPTGADSPSAETTPAPAPAVAAGDGNNSGAGNVQYVTVTALKYDDFPSNESNTNKRDAMGALSPVELGIKGGAETSKRDVTFEIEKRALDKARHLQTHNRHVHRHLFQRKNGLGKVEER